MMVYVAACSESETVHASAYIYFDIGTPLICVSSGLIIRAVKIVRQGTQDICQPSPQIKASDTCS